MIRDLATYTIALVAPLSYEGVTQRPHHWEKQAKANGHTVQVYTLPQEFPLGYFAHPMKAVRNASLHDLSSGLRETKLCIDPECEVVIYSAPPILPQFSCDLSRSILIYDCHDDWRKMPRLPLGMEKSEYAIAKRADLILGVSKPLCEKLAKRYGESNVICVPNGCDYDIFAEYPSHSASISKRKRKITVGYIGTVNEWFDWDAVKAIARSHPHAVIQIIGPVLSPLPSGIPDNVRLFGRLPYGKMPYYTTRFDIGIIPFTMDRSYAQSISPIKLYEYLAAGKPVVSSPLPDAVQLSQKAVVHTAATPEEFVHEVDAILELKDNAAYIHKRKALARKNTWSNRWMHVEKEITRLLRNRRCV